MFQRRLLFWLAALPLFAVQPLLASTVQVGTCKPKLASFANISAAVSSVPPGSTIQVCPGVYAEQVVIKQPLNLEGISISNSDQATVAVPSGGLMPNVTSTFGESVAAQILVENAAPVNITNLTVDGTGGDMGGSPGTCTWVAGIFYGSSSSGEIRRVRTSNQTNTQCGVGIWAENGDSSDDSLLIRNSTIYNVDAAGIFVGSLSAATLNVTARENIIDSNAGLFGIVIATAKGDFTNNEISNALFGIFHAAPEVRVSDNTITTTDFGISLENGGVADRNKISASNTGIALDADGAVLRENKIFTTTVAAVEFNCHASVTRDNFINDALVGFDQGPPVAGDNTFANTATILANSCAPASPVTKANVRGFSQSGGEDSDWHTPSKPYGRRNHR
jgi:hypothetical protein